MSNSVFKEDPKSQVAITRAMVKEHPVYRRYTASQRKVIFDLVADGNIRTESLVEDTIARRGKFVRSPKSKGDDFLNGQGEVKTATLVRRIKLTPSMKKKGRTTPDIEYTGGVPGLKNKTGPLRVVVYNSYTEKVEYYFIPAKAWPRLSSKGRIDIRYRKTTDDLSRISKYKTDFVGLCRKA
jgi:hypothetical protein